MALVTTVASATANSYADADYAENYFALTSRSDDWAALSSDQQEATLYEAMLFIEAQDYIGGRATSGQALQWPRVSGQRRRFNALLVGFGLSDFRGRFWAANVIPEPIKNAQCEMALTIGLDQSWLSEIEDIATIRTGVVTLMPRTSAERSSKLNKIASLWMDGFLLTGGGTRRLMKA